MTGEVVTVALAAAAAALGAGVALAAGARSRTRAHARLEALVAELDRDLGALSERLAVALARAERARQASGGALGVTLDLEELLDRLVSEAAARTGADAVVVRVDGHDGEPALATFGADDGPALLGAALGPPDARPFRALTIDWAQGPAQEGAAAAYESAVVVPIVEEGAQTGALVAYGHSAGSFRAEHVHALQALAEEAAAGLAAARRIAAVERRTERDPDTGTLNRAGYEAELEREVARARRTGRPLSVLLLQLGEEGPSRNRALPEVAALLSRLTRATDALCRPHDHELAVLLPGTKGTGARRFLARVRDEAALSLSHVGPLTFSAGLVEWRPDETSASLAQRVATAVRTVEVLPAPPAERAAAGDEAPRPANGSFRESLEREVARAVREARPLTVLVVHVGSPDLEADEGPAAARARAEVSSRLAEIVAGSGTSGTLARNRFAAVLSATAADAETAIAVLRESLRAGPLGRAPLAAGIAELVPGDDAATILGRAERAAEQARRRGDGTVVVAAANGGR